MSRGDPMGSVCLIAARMCAVRESPLGTGEPSEGRLAKMRSARPGHANESMPLLESNHLVEKDRRGAVEARGQGRDAGRRLIAFRNCLTCSRCTARPPSAHDANIARDQPRPAWGWIRWGVRKLRVERRDEVAAITPLDRLGVGRAALVSVKPSIGKRSVFAHAVRLLDIHRTPEVCVAGPTTSALPAPTASRIPSTGALPGGSKQRSPLTGPELNRMNWDVACRMAIN